MIKTFEYNNNPYNIVVVKKKNKNTYLRVQDNNIVITTNYLITNHQLDKLIKDNEDAIIKLINKSINKKEKEEKFYLFGKCYDIITGSFNDIDIKDNKIFVKDKVALTKWLNKLMLEIFKERLEHWQKQFEENIPTPNLKIRNMKTRWGVCNIKTHNVTLNSNLIKYDKKCLDYVIIHELSHFIYPNHSKEFWLLVSKYCPNYKYLRNELKK